MAVRKKVINEIFYLRAIACLAIVFLHSITSSLGLLGVDNEGTKQILRVTQLFLMFGTPTFVFISEVLITNSYQDRIPNGFFNQRIKFILVPYIVMGIFYAWFNLWNLDMLNVTSFLSLAMENVLLGRYHGYFVLIIFQFYILHFIFQKYIIDKYPPWLMLSIALIVNVGYLGVFNVIRLPESAHIYLLQFWRGDFKLLFMGWIFYFTVAFYCGKNFNSTKELISRNIGKIVLLLILSVSLLMFNYFILGFSSVHSKRFDIVFYTISIIGILIYSVSKMKKVPSVIMLVSRYAFGIYLLHPFFIKLIERYEWIPNDNLLFYIVITFLLAVMGSIVLTFLLNRFKIGTYIVGRVKSAGLLAEKTKTQKDQSVA